MRDEEALTTRLFGANLRDMLSIGFGRVLIELGRDEERHLFACK